ncbi:heat shock protein 70 [Rhynchospora pubera]|uniref:Heat shock protein 70 n=1 Tax=Rhynchospora pubera TaxID=906938 RepID=A0AAV8CQE2_9POAL|nr:heat shock protein 70 [Rhynchospora pubera]
MNSAVGIDAGNATSVIAAARGRGVDVILNDESSRETPSALSFPPSSNSRLLGAASVASHTLSPSSFFTSLKHHIYTGSSHQNTPFSPVQLFAMLLAHLKSIAEKSLQTHVDACVIGIPSYFTDLQRRAYLDAAEIAGLNPLRLMHDLTATGLGYGIYKSDLGSVNNVALVDVGECDTQVSILEFQSGAMRVLSHASDPTLGGRDFDQVLFDHFAEKFKIEYRIDVRSNKKASVRLLMACEKVKKILSANAEAPLSIECLMEEKDVKGLIKREKFEKMCGGLIERVLDPCRKAMGCSGLPGVDKLHAVELVGSGSRVPAISRVLAGFFRREPSRTINASECVARGCALHCAMLSPVFKVRDYEVQDSYPFSIGFTTEEGPVSTSSSNAIFKRGQSFPSVKMLTFHKRNSFSLEAFYTDPAELPPGAATNISKFEIGPFEAHSEKSRVKVKVRLNLHGIVYVESATLIEEDEVTDSPMRDGSYRVEDMDIDDESRSQPDNIEPAGKKGRRLRRQDLSVKEIVYGGMSREELQKAQEKERELQYKDLLMEQTRDRKNQLEGYVYDIRNKLFERYRSFASESEKEGISTSLQQTEDWLYEDGDNETEKVYACKIEELKKLVDPIEIRCKEEEARASATRELLDCIVGHRMAVDSMTSYEKDAVLNECAKAEQWLRDRSQQQEPLPRNVDPVLWSHEISKKRQELDLMCKNIVSRGSPARTENNRND